MNNFDKIICINLIERKDKYNNVLKLFNKLNINVNFYFAKKHINSGRIGCFESHINVIKECYKNNLKNILIFEDDIIETLSYNESVINDINIYLNNNNWCEYYQLGYSILPHEFTNYFSSINLNNNSIKYNGNCAHAYILNRNGMKRILENWENVCYKENLDLDIYYKKIFVNNGACICPILFDQNFCIDGDNDKATTPYYKNLRYISCFQFNYSLLYFISLIRFYINYLFIVIILIILLIIFYKTYFIKIKKPKIKKNI